MEKLKTWNRKGHCASPLLSFQKQPPKFFSKLAVLKFREIPWKAPAVDFCFRFRAQTFLSTEIELRNFEEIIFWNIFDWLLYQKAATVRKIHRKAPVLESLFNKLVGLRLQYRCFLVNIRKFLSAFVLKNICERLLLYTSLVSSTIISWIHTELLLHVQPS